LTVPKTPKDPRNSQQIINSNPLSKNLSFFGYYNIYFSLSSWLRTWGITKEEYDKKLKEMKEKQYDINIQIEDHTRADKNYYITASTVLNLAKNAFELFKSSEVLEKRAILNYLLQNCVANGNELEFSIRSPYNHILTFANQPTWLTTWGDVRMSIISK
jgi:hypothetical protein